MLAALEATDPQVGGKEGETHLAGACFRLTDFGMAMATATFTGAQVESTGHACVACVTVLGARRLGSGRALLGRACSGQCPLDGGAGVGLGRTGELKGEEPGSTKEVAGGQVGGAQGSPGRMGHGTRVGRCTAPLRAQGPGRCPQAQPRPC